MHKLHKNQSIVVKFALWVKENWMIVVAVLIMYFIVLFTFGVIR